MDDEKEDRKCTATHPEYGVRCTGDASHVEPDGFDMGQWTDYSSMSPGRPHRFELQWLDETVKSGHFEDGREWKP